ncbi:hypothetical protein SKAU_G00350890 [Synaphobranchus kaupii]|uniref:Testis expressed 9 n=1 Tax=Synaphobranchus kaupii TaxID=118154 RepID=A0A9Q1II56_SYNKA|nr:hypothetical protein SKAU_G00350890 [Synaphobranchus kaupii]
MAEAKRRSSFEEKKPQSSKTERPQAHRPMTQPCHSQKTSLPMNLLAKEEEYKRINAKLEAKTAELVRQAEEVMREQNEVLSRPISSHLSLGIEDEKEDFMNLNPQVPSVKQPTAKVLTKTVTSSKPLQTGLPIGNRTKRAPKLAKNCTADDVAVLEDFVDFSLAKTISTIEGKLEEGGTHENIYDDIMPSVGNEMGSEAQIRFLKAKLRVMQEEVHRLSQEYNKKDDENASLSTKIKEVEEDRARLQRMINIQRSQLEKHKVVAEDSNKKCEGLQHHVTALQKEIEGLKRTQKQATFNHSATEVRLNRALEEAEKFKLDLNKIKQSSKDSTSQGHQKMETLQAENKKLERQKAELIAGFKKQLKLIDVLKRQKMHFEAAKMLSFTEEEFMKALDWGKS